MSEENTELLTGAEAIARSRKTGEAFVHVGTVKWLRVRDGRVEFSFVMGKEWGELNAFDPSFTSKNLISRVFRMVDPSEWFNAKQKPEPVLGSKFIAMILNRYPDDEAAEQRIEFYSELMTECVLPLIRREIANAKEAK